MIRNKDTDRADFIFYSNRIIRLLVEEGLNHLPVIEHTVTTPVGHAYNGLMFKGKICGVSIMRAGEAMEQGLRDCCRSVRIGKILIQRDEETSKPKLFYDKLPEDIASRWVLLLDPMFATGGSAIMAVEVLKSRGVPEDRILFLNLIASPEGTRNFVAKFPKVTVVTAFIDEVSSCTFFSPLTFLFANWVMAGSRREEVCTLALCKVPANPAAVILYQAWEISETDIIRSEVGHIHG
jgi:uracil phosphoribosyltransferase